MNTTLKFHVGSYILNFMNFGLNYSPVTFQRALDIVLAAYKWHNFFAYLYDRIFFPKPYILTSIKLRRYLMHFTVLM